MKAVIKTGVLMFAAGLGMVGCGGGSGGGSDAGGATAGGGTPGAGLPVVTGGLFAQPLFSLENDIFYNGSATPQQRIIKSAYSRTGDVISVKDEVLSGAGDYALTEDYTITKTQVYKTESTDGGLGARIALLADSGAGSYTFAPYAPDGGKSGGLVTYAYDTKPLSGLLLADGLSPSFLMPPDGPGKAKRLRDSGKTFPSGSEGLAVKSYTYHEDTVEFSEEDATLATSFEMVFESQPPGTKYSHYTFKDIEVRCIQEADFELPDLNCVGRYQGRFYVVTITPKGKYALPAGISMLFNQTAAAALTDGIRTDYK